MADMFDQFIADRDPLLSTESAIIPEVLGMDSSVITSELLVCCNPTSDHLNTEGTATLLNRQLIKSVFRKCSEHNLYF